MGQEQSTLINDGNIDETEARVRPRNKKVTTRRIKTVVSCFWGSPPRPTFSFVLVIVIFEQVAVTLESGFIGYACATDTSPSML